MLAAADLWVESESDAALFSPSIPHDVKPIAIELGQPLDLPGIDSYELALENQLVRLGYPNAQVTHKIDFAADGARWHIRIRQGPQIHVGTLAFVGSKSIPEARLGEITDIKPGDLFVRNLIDRACVLLEAAYCDQGRIEVSVESNVEKPLQDPVTVTFVIKEGPVFKIGKLRVHGEALGPEKDVLARMKSKPNTVFSRSTMVKDLEELKSGAPQNIVVEPETDVDQVNSIVDIVLYVTEH